MEQESDETPSYMAIEEESDYIAKEEHSSKPHNYSFWVEMRKAPFVILGLALVAAIVYGFIITGDRNALNEELEVVNNTLSLTRAQLLQTVGDHNDTKQSLAVTEGDLRDTKQLLASTQTDLTSTLVELTSTQSQLSSTWETLELTQSQLNSMENTLTSTEQTLTSTQGQLEMAEAKILLFQETFGADVFSGQQPQVTGGGSVGSPNIMNNPNANNVSWGQLESFLLSDPTDDGTYSLYSYNCVSFAEMLHNNAEAAGIKSAFVAINFKDEPIGHAVNAFVTTNKGLVYVDNTGGTSLGKLNEQLSGLSVERDRIAYIQKNRKYGVLPLHTFISPEYSYYEEIYEVAKDVLKYWWVPGDIVESIEIYW